jgi:hypothetical protein
LTKAEEAGIARGFVMISRGKSGIGSRGQILARLRGEQHMAMATATA